MPTYTQLSTKIVLLILQNSTDTIVLDISKNSEINEDYLQLRKRLSQTLQ